MKHDRGIRMIVGISSDLCDIRRVEASIRAPWPPPSRIASSPSGERSACEARCQSRPLLLPARFARRRKQGGEARSAPH